VPNAEIRRSILKKVHRVVVKIGSYVLTTPSWKLDRNVFSDVIETIAAVRSQGREVVLVSSGAIASGMGKLGLKSRPRQIAQEQATAAVGQIGLMGLYERLFGKFGIPVGQMLLTHSDLNNRKRFLNARQTIQSLFEFGAVPVINENDTVVVEEIKFGDNDYLSSLVTNLAQADLLVILTDIDGFYDKDPHRFNDARLIPLIEHVDGSIESLALGPGSKISRGGMATKITAAKTAAQFGVPTIIANGKTRGTLGRILAGDDTGTLILPQQNKLASRKHWIAFILKPQGVIVVDDGAREAMVRHNRSLLPSGITAVEGAFDLNEAVVCRDRHGVDFARGLVAYRSAEIDRIKGLKTAQIAGVLGRSVTQVEVINKDDLVILNHA
jgi:glutamate 5-kinase